MGNAASVRDVGQTKQGQSLQPGADGEDEMLVVTQPELGKLFNPLEFIT